MSMLKRYDLVSLGNSFYVLCNSLFIVCVYLSQSLVCTSSSLRNQVPLDKVFKFRSMSLYFC